MLFYLLTLFASCTTSLNSLTGTDILLRHFCICSVCKRLGIIFRRTTVADFQLFDWSGYVLIYIDRLVCNLCMYYVHPTTAMKMQEGGRRCPHCYTDDLRIYGRATLAQS